MRRLLSRPFARGFWLVVCLFTGLLIHSLRPATAATDTTPPTVSLTAPANGVIVRGSVTVSATASDNVGVRGVQFLLDGASLNTEDTLSPYSISWNTTSAAAGPHVLSARARDAAGNLGTAAVVNVTVDNQPPSGTVVINAGSAATNSRTVTLTLSATDSSSAVTQMRFSNNGSSFTTQNYATTATWTLATGDGTKTVYAQFKDTVGNWSASVTDTIVLDTTAPTISSVAASSLTDKSAVITWTTNEAATSQVEYGLTTSYGQSISDPTLVTAHSVALTGLTATTTYNYRVRSKDAFGTERIGSNSTFRTTADGVPPTVPTAVSAQAVSDTRIGVTWTASTDNVAVTGYKVFRNGVQAGSVAGTSFTDSALVPNTSYGYTVAAFDAAGNTSPQSSSASAATLADQSPPTVAISSPANNATLFGTVAIVASNVTDDVAVAGVTFQVDGILAAPEVTAPPYSVNVDTRTLSNAPHVLSAVARDTSNNTTVSLPVAVTVNNAAPPPNYTLSVADTGTGSGTVSGGAISCGAACSAPISSGTIVTLTAAPAVGSLFGGWSGACSGFSLTCAVTVSADTAVSASFMLPPPSVTKVSDFIDMQSGADGAVITTAIAGNDTRPLTGASGAWAYDSRTGPPVELYASKAPALPALGPVQVGNLLVPDSGTGGSYRKHADKDFDFIDYVLNPKPSKISFGFFMYFGGNWGQAPFRYYDVFLIQAQNGDFITFNVIGGSPLTFQIETQGCTSGLPIVAGVTNKWYWITMLWDTAKTTGTLSVYDPSGWAKLGTGSCSISNSPLDFIGVGDYSEHGNPPIDADWYTAALMMDKTGATFPLLPSAAFAPPPPPDSIPPVVSLTAPTGGSIISSTYNLTASASDNTAVASVQFKVDGVQVGLVTTPPYSLAWDTTTIGNGAHTIAATATDIANNQATSSASIVVSNPAPPIPVAVDATGPSAAGAGCAKCSSLSWSHTVSGANRLLTAGVAVGSALDSALSLTVTYNGVPMTSAGKLHSNNASAGFVELFYLKAPVTGAHTVQVTLAGGTADLSAGSVSFTGVNQTTPVRNIATNAGQGTAPSVSVVSAPQDLVVSAVVDGCGGTVAKQTPRWIKNQNCNTGGGNGAQSTAPGAASVTMSYTVSSDIWAIVAMDIVAAVTPPYDTAAPSTPANFAGNPVSTSQIALSWTASTDNVAVAGYKLSRNGALLATITTNSYVDAGLQLATAYSYSVTAFDATGNVSPAATTSASTLADTTPPTVSISSPPAGATISGTVSIVASNVGDDIAVAGVTFQVDGSNVAPEVTLPPYSVSFDTTTIADGNHVLTAIARDTSGNRTTSSAIGAVVHNISAPPATPTLIQHVSTASNQIDRAGNPFFVSLPNSAGAGNTLVVGVSYQFAAGRTVALGDDKSNAWTLAATTPQTPVDGQIVSSLYYALNVTAGTQKITITFDSPVLGFQAVASEFYNVAGVAAADGGNGATASAPSVSAGSFTTTTAGDLVYLYASDTNNTNAASAFAAGAGFTLLSADLQLGAVAEYAVQSSPGPLTPAVTVTGGADQFNAIAMALKPGAAGTPPPAGIRIVHVYHVRYRTGAALQFPSTGNLLVSMASVGTDTSAVSGMTTDLANTWIKATVPQASTEAQIWYAANALTSPNLRITPTVSLPSVSMVFYDIAGAAASPYDDVAGVPDAAQVNATNDSLLAMPVITPGTANGLVFAVLTNRSGPTTGVIGPGVTLDSVTYGNEVAPDSIENGDGYAHFYNSTAGPISFGWLMNSATLPEDSVAVAIAFKSAGGPQ